MQGWNELKDILSGCSLSPPLLPHDCSSSENTASDRMMSHRMDLNPIPVPPMANLQALGMDWNFLANVEPIDGEHGVSLQVAQITLGMATLKRQIEELNEWLRSCLRENRMLPPPM